MLDIPLYMPDNVDLKYNKDTYKYLFAFSILQLLFISSYEGDTP